MPLIYFLLTISLAIYLYFRHKYSYWKRKNIESLPIQIPFGNVRDLFLIRRNYAEVFGEIYQAIKGPFAGIYCGWWPVLFIKDLDLVKDILVKNFDSFHDRGVHYNEQKEPLLAHLFRIEGSKWRFLRNKLSPAFSSGKLKNMFQTVLQCGNTLEDVIGEIVKGESTDIQLTRLCQRYTTDVISSVGFGFEANSLRDESSIFYQHVVEVKSLNLMRRFAQSFLMFIPEILKWIPLRSMSVASEKFFLKLVHDTVKYREENSVVRNDFMQLLIKLRNRKSLFDENDNIGITEGDLSQPAFTMTELTAQAFIFYIAGLETSRLTLSNALYFMALNPELQDHLLREIDSTLDENDKLTYEIISQMEYLDMVISETLRLRPPLSMLNRICTRTYTLPNTDLTIEKGTRVLIDVLSLQKDPKYFPEPEKFDPERFSKENRRNIKQYSYMPFGEGPRSCIGMRQGKMKAKVGLVSILRRHRVEVSEKTVSMDKLAIGSILLEPVEELYLKVTKRDRYIF